MELERIDLLINQWKEMTYAVLDLKKISLSETQELLKETYKLLIKFHKQEVIPKELCKLLLEMDGFLYFSSLMEDKEVGIDFYHYQLVSLIVKALKKGFFEGGYSCSYPQLQILDAHAHKEIIDFDKDIFKK